MTFNEFEIRILITMIDCALDELCYGGDLFDQGVVLLERFIKEINMTNKDDIEYFRSKYGITL